MSTPLLDNLVSELTGFSDAGSKQMDSLLEETGSFIGELKLLERELELQLQTESPEPVDLLLLNEHETWYKKSIGSLKSYNGLINKFVKQVLNNSKYNINLDEAYTYPLLLDNIPVQYLKEPNPSATTAEITLQETKKTNQEELMKAIILHLLKIGQSDLIKDIVQANSDLTIDVNILDKFKLLNEIVDLIVLRHDLTKALDWFRQKLSNDQRYQTIEFKFHVLQYTLLLNGNNLGLDCALDAYMYALKNFPRFFQDYLAELSPLMTLLVFRTEDSDPNDEYAKKHMVTLLSTFMEKMKTLFARDQEKKSIKKNESKFVDEIMTNFDRINECQSLFQTLSNEFISHYCKDLNLSNDSSLFQSVLSGFINLPSFYKYNQIQQKLSKVRTTKDESENMSLNSKNIVVAPYHYDLPFQLPDSNRFLFNYHPIFICPVSKEQLIPLTWEETEKQKKAKRPKLDSGSEEVTRSMHNPAVVLKHCQHVALKESIWQLSKRGCENFRCHYCYKKHKFSEVTEVYFIDL